MKIPNFCIKSDIGCKICCVVIAITGILINLGIIALMLYITGAVNDRQ
jgi:hypothetical protein